MIIKDFISLNHVIFRFSEIFKQQRTGGAETSLSQQMSLRPEDTMDALMFEVAVRDFMSKAVLYASESSKISTSISLASAQAHA